MEKEHRYTNEDIANMICLYSSINNRVRTIYKQSDNLKEQDIRSNLVAQYNNIAREYTLGIPLEIRTLLPNPFDPSP